MRAVPIIWKRTHTRLGRWALASVAGLHCAGHWRHKRVKTAAGGTTAEAAAFGRCVGVLLGEVVPRKISGWEHRARWRRRRWWSRRRWRWPRPRISPDEGPLVGVGVESDLGSAGEPAAVDTTDERGIANRNTQRAVKLRKPATVAGLAVIPPEERPPMHVCHKKRCISRSAHWEVHED